MLKHSVDELALPTSRIVPDHEMAILAAENIDSTTSHLPTLCFAVAGGQIAPATLQIFLNTYLRGRPLTVIATDERMTGVRANTNAHQLEGVLNSLGQKEKIELVVPSQQVDIAESATRFASDLMGSPPVDVALFGVGPDGHIASHFSSGSTMVSGRVTIVENAPGDFPHRVTLSLPFLRDIPQRVALMAGREKVAVLKALAINEDLPVNQVHPTIWFISAAAMSSFHSSRDTK